MSARDNLLFIKNYSQGSTFNFFFFRKMIISPPPFSPYFFPPHFFCACESCSWLCSSEFWLSGTSGLKSIHCVQSGMWPILVVFRHLEMVFVSRGQEKFLGISHFCCDWQNLVLVWPGTKGEKYCNYCNMTWRIIHMIYIEKKIYDKNSLSIIY